MEKDQMIEPGQAVVTVGSSGRSIGTNENRAHTHTQFLRPRSDDPTKYESFIPTEREIELFRKAGFIEN